MDVRVAVAALGQAPGADNGRPLVVEVAEACEAVEGRRALLLRETSTLQSRVELRSGAVGGSQRAERDVLGSWLSS